MSDSLGLRLAIGFVILCILLLAYSAVHWGRRRKQIVEEMARRGWTRRSLPDDPKMRSESVTELIPEGLFYPNGCPPKTSDGRHLEVQDVLPRIVDGWTSNASGPTGSSIDLLEVSIARQRRRPGEQGSSSQLNRTVFRVTPTGDRPPDLLIEERVLFKGQVKDAVRIHGRDHLDPHYFVFSAAPTDLLERWIDEAVVELLARHRGWTVAAHAGVLFLTRNHSLQRMDDLASFLDEGDALIQAFLGERGT